MSNKETGSGLFGDAENFFDEVSRQAISRNQLVRLFECVACFVRNLDAIHNREIEHSQIRSERFESL